MNCRLHTEGNVALVTPRNTRLDARIADELKDQLLAVVRDGHARIALDLSGVDFVDSSGLGALVAVRRQLEGQGELAIAGVRPAVMKLFRLTRLDRVFRLFDSAPEALAALHN